MEPGEFNKRLAELVDEAARSGLHKQDVVSALDDRRTKVAHEIVDEQELSLREAEDLFGVM